MKSCKVLEYPMKIPTITRNSLVKWLEHAFFMAGCLLISFVFLRFPLVSFALVQLISFDFLNFLWFGAGRISWFSFGFRWFCLFSDGETPRKRNSKEKTVTHKGKSKDAIGIIHRNAIWLNYNISLTWILRPSIRVWFPYKNRWFPVLRRTGFGHDQIYKDIP